MTLVAGPHIKTLLVSFTPTCSTGTVVAPVWTPAHWVALGPGGGSGGEVGTWAVFWGRRSAACGSLSSGRPVGRASSCRGRRLQKRISVSPQQRHPEVKLTEWRIPGNGGSPRSRVGPLPAEAPL